MRQTAWDLPKTNVGFSYGQINSGATDNEIVISQGLAFPTSYVNQDKLAKLNIRMVNPGDLSVEQRRQATASISAAIKNSLRKTDLLFDARERGEEYALLLCCTGEEHIDLVINKIKEQAGKAAGPDNPAKYAFSYQVLFHSDRKISQEGH